MSDTENTTPAEAPAEKPSLSTTYEGKEAFESAVPEAARGAYHEPRPGVFVSLVSDPKAKEREERAAQTRDEIIALKESSKEQAPTLEFVTAEGGLDSIKERLALVAAGKVGEKAEDVKQRLAEAEAAGERRAISRAETAESGIAERDKLIEGLTEKLKAQAVVFEVKNALDGHPVRPEARGALTTLVSTQLRVEMVDGAEKVVAFDSNGKTRYAEGSTEPMGPAELLAEIRASQGFFFEAPKGGGMTGSASGPVGSGVVVRHGREPLTPEMRKASAEGRLVNEHGEKIT